MRASGVEEEQSSNDGDPRHCGRALRHIAMQCSRACALVDKIRRTEGTEEEMDADLELFIANCLHPSTIISARVSLRFMLPISRPPVGKQRTLSNWIRQSAPDRETFPQV